MRRSRLIHRAAASASASIAVVAMALAPNLARAAPVLAVQSSIEQIVSATLTPRDPAAPSLELEIAFDTPVQPIDDDVLASSVLVDGTGQRHPPLAWRRDGPGGRHRKAVLVFAPLQPPTASIELQIRRAGEPVARSSTWALR